MAKYIDLYLDQGSDLSKTFIAKDFSGTVINLTGYTVDGAFSTSHTDDDNRTSFSSLSITDAEHGVISISITNSDSLLLNADSRYVYNIAVTSGSSVKTSVMEGILFVSGKVN